MASLRTFTHAFVALLSMVAIVLGALEHESLLFQGNLAEEDVVATPVSGADHLPEAGDSLTERENDTGTEATFRSESNTLGSAPDRRARFIRRIQLRYVVLTLTGAPLHLGQQARSRVTGVLPRLL